MAEKLIPAPLDDKNVCDDFLRDDTFADFYQAEDSRNGATHLIGTKSVDTDEFYFDGIIDVKWYESRNVIEIELLACPCREDFPSMCEDFFRYYEKTFKEMEVQEEGYPRIQTSRRRNTLMVGFYWVDD